MRVALISDIHSNWEALQVVLQKIEELGVDRIVCLGDVVGYGADPNRCAEEVLARADPVIRGNHDKAAADLMEVTYFNDMARQAVAWTRRTLTEGNLERIRGLPAGPLPIGGFLICHGSPMDEDQYIFNLGTARRSFEAVQAGFPDRRICFFGHTHLPIVIEETGDAYYPEEKIRLEEAKSYLINPGSVGQPRDGVPLASFGLLDEEEPSFTLFRIEYPVEEAQRKIIAAGLPAFLARRLASGN
jgi:diadenosine tetraphosphatase ApaH/serine/threonine PP2A family protein phosphatase